MRNQSSTCSSQVDGQGCRSALAARPTRRNGSTLIPNTIGSVATAMVASGDWRRVWVYDNWKKQVLWSYPPVE